MHRWLVALLISLAVLLLLSPGIIGRLAERGIDSSLTQVSAESEAVDIAQESFERGWFSSAGRHRVALRAGSLRELIEANRVAAASSGEPALVIDTRLDHGLIPISSVQREGGSLSPALANAVSTLQVDPGDGTLTPLPGRLYSFFGVGGGTTFRYLVEAGDERVAAAALRWSKVDLSYALTANGLGQTIMAVVENLSANSPDIDATVDALDIAWSYDDRTDTLGDGRLQVDLRGLTFAPGANPGGGDMGPGEVRVESLGLSGESAVANDRLRAEGRFSLQVRDIATFGDARVGLDMNLQGVDAKTLHSLLDTYRERAAVSDADPMTMIADPVLQQLGEAVFAGGGQLDITDAVFRVDPGEARLNLSIDVAETRNGDGFSWPTVLLNSSGTLDARIAASLYDALVQIDPQVRGALASGMLIKAGDQYVMNIEFAKGRLVINGAPMSLPLGAAAGLPR